MNARRKHDIVTMIFSAVLACSGAGIAHAQTSNAKGKISRNMYRIPYGNGRLVTMTHDYVDHGNTPAGDTGSMDMADQIAPYAPILAAAAGTVINVRDNLNGCGCNSAYGQCGNLVQIQHANGEVSSYLHIAQNSATSRGIAEDVVVTQGQQIGVEGDVGWTCGNGSDPRTSSCVLSVPPGTGDCGPHLHWNVVRQTTGERVNPMTCAISNNIYVNDITYLAADCSTAECPTDRTFGATAYNGFGVFRVFQADNNINASAFSVTNYASVVFHAGNKVRLTPGFHATEPGYFRAEIGPCNTTAATPSSSTAAADVVSPPAYDLSKEAQGY